MAMKRSKIIVGKRTRGRTTFLLANKLANVNSIPPGYVRARELFRSGTIHKNTLNERIFQAIASGSSPENLPFRWLTGGGDGRGEYLVSESYAKELEEKARQLEKMVHDKKIVPLEGIGREIEKELNLEKGTVNEGTIRWWLHYTGLRGGRHVLNGKIYMTSDVAGKVREIFRYLHADTVTRTQAFGIIGKKSSGGYKSSEQRRRLIDRWIGEGLLPHIPNEAHKMVSKKRYALRVSRPIVETIAHFYRVYCTPKQAATIMGLSHSVIDPRVSANPKEWKMPGVIPAMGHPLGDIAHENTRAFVAIKLARLIAIEIKKERQIPRRKFIPAIAIDECIDRAKKTYLGIVGGIEGMKDFNSKVHAEGYGMETQSVRPVPAKVEVMLRKTVPPITKALPPGTVTVRTEEKRPVQVTAQKIPRDRINSNGTYSTGDLLEILNFDIDKGVRALKSAGWEEDQIRTKYGRYHGNAILKMLELLGKK